jgi:hypothetical protein
MSQVHPCRKGSSCPRATVPLHDDRCCGGDREGGIDPGSERARISHAAGRAQPACGLSPLQAHLDLALPPNRAANALFEVDVGAMRRLGIEVPASTPVGRSYNMPGGGLEVPIDRAIPPELLRRVR